MCRPGRLDKLLYVDLPSAAERVEILGACARKTPLARDVDLVRVAHHPRAEGLSGADLAALVREAATMAVKELFAQLDLDLDGPALGGPSSSSTTAGLGGAAGLEARVEMRHFAAALERANPSVSRQQRRRFETLRRRFAGQPVGHRGEAEEPAAVGAAGEAGGAGAGEGADGVGADAVVEEP